MTANIDITYFSAYTVLIRGCSLPGKLVLQYLESVKRLVSSGRWAFIPRKKNLDSLALYGLTVQDAKQEILSLDSSDYERGPEPDYSYSGDIWIFKRCIDGTDFYIKLKIDMANDGMEIVKCLSFHD